MSGYVRDRMATSVYHLIARHIEPLDRAEWGDMEQRFIENYVEEAFRKLKWRHDVFDAEYLVKKNKDDREYEDTVKVLSDLRLEQKVLRETGLNSRYWVRKKEYLEKENVAENMRKRFLGIV